MIMDFSEDTFYDDILMWNIFDWKYIYLYKRQNFGVTRRLFSQNYYLHKFLGDTRSK